MTTTDRVTDPREGLPPIGSTRVELVRRIHDAPHRVVLVVTGGGSRVIVDLLSVPGASRTVLEAIVPYAERSLRDLLGAAAGPDQAVSRGTAVALARVALDRAGRLAGAEAGGPQPPLLGVACTATLATDRPKRGEHRAEVSICGPGGTTTCSLVLDKGARDRRGEEDLVADLVLALLADVMGPGEGDAALAARLGLGPGDRLALVVDDRAGREGTDPADPAS